MKPRFDHLVRLGALPVLAFAALGGLGGCGSPASDTPSGALAAGPAGGSPAGEKTSVKLTSTAFSFGKPIPRKFTSEGEDVSPPLAWTGLPKGTRELALVCDDPDAPGKEPWVHWVIYKIPPTAAGLPEGVPPDAELEQPAGALQGRNSWPSGQTIGYRGPQPPPGKPHRYFFKLYALDAPLRAAPGLTKKALLEAIQGHVLAEGVLMGTYQR